MRKHLLQSVVDVVIPSLTAKFLPQNLDAIKLIPRAAWVVDLAVGASSA